VNEASRASLRSRVARVPGARRAYRVLRRAATTSSRPRDWASPRLPGIGRTGAAEEVLSLTGFRVGRVAVLLVHPTQRDEVVAWLDLLEGATVHVLSGKEVPEWDLLGRGVRFHRARAFPELELALKRIGTIDLLVNLLPVDLVPGKKHDQYTVFRRLFPYVARGGAFVLDRRTSPAASTLLGVERWTRLLAASEDPIVERGLPRRDVLLAEATGSVVLSRDMVVATKRHELLLKLREAEVGPILGVREPELEVTELVHRKSKEFVSRATVFSHGDLVDPSTFTSSYTVPALTGRHYRGRIGSPGGTLLYAGGTVLPDSFRWYLADNPKNVRLTASVPGFSRLESRHVPRQELAGDYYSVDSSHSGHFGHLTTEVVSRLWAWDQAKQQYPGLKALFHLAPGTKRHPQLEIDLLTAFGIREEDIAWVNQPVWLESVASATPMWHNREPYYADPDIAQVWDRMTENLLARSSLPETHPRLFLSRRAPNRTCRNRPEVEDFFRERGFEVVLPERLPLADQVALFAGAEVIAGFAGSNMFNLMHARRLRTLIVLSHSGYVARNEHLFSAVRGGEAHYFWSRPDIPQPRGGYSKKAFNSSWEFDFAANGKELDEVLAGLG
jgi:capsular polysaccharide biosynthesis protein